MTRDDIVQVLRPVVDRLNETSISYVLVGGITVPFYLADDLAGSVRPTKDIDIIVAAVKLSHFDRVEERLRAAGFQNHPEVRHRWILDGALIDVLPAESEVLPNVNRWYPVTYSTAEPVEIAPGCGAMMASPSCFLATKMEAFIGRGKGDFLASHDLEDFVSVIDGRESIEREIAMNCPEEVREFLRVSVRQLLVNREFLDAIEGFLPPNYRTDERLQRLVFKLEQLAS